MTKKGFTLIELLAVIVILATIMLIIIPLVTSNVKEGRDVASEETENSIILAGRHWGNDHKNNLPKENGGSICISVTALIQYGYLNNSVPDKYKDYSILIKNVKNVYYYTFQEGKCENDGTEIYKTLTFNYQENGGNGANKEMQFSR